MALIGTIIFVVLVLAWVGAVSGDMRKIKRPLRPGDLFLHRDITFASLKRDKRPSTARRPRRPL